MMRFILTTVLVSLCFVTECDAQQTKQEDITVLKNVAVVDVDAGTSTPEMSVVLSAGKIKTITKTAGFNVPKNARVIDLKGRYLVPGFVEMHAHLFLHPWDEQGSIMQQYDRGSILKMLRVMLAFGITTVRDPGSETEAAVTLRDMIAAGKVTGPRVFTAGRILATGRENPEPFVFVDSEQAVRNEVRWQAAAGVDIIKVYSSMPPNLLKVAIEEAHANRLRVIGHLHAASWTQAAEMGIDSIAHNAPWNPEYLPENARARYQQTLFGRVYWLEHVDLNSPAIHALIEELVKHRVAVDPTLISLHTKFWGDDKRYLQHPQMSFAPELFTKGWPRGRFTASWTHDQYLQAQAQWSKALAFTEKMFDNGVLLTVGTDTPTPYVIPGVSYHEELKLLADAKIGPADLLRMATVNGAKAIGREKEFGKVKTGMRADLVVLKNDPLETVENFKQIELVIKEGVVYDPQKLLKDE